MTMRPPPSMVQNFGNNLGRQLNQGILREPPAGGPTMRTPPQGQPMRGQSMLLGGSTGNYSYVPNTFSGQPQPTRPAIPTAPPRPMGPQPGGPMRPGGGMGGPIKASPQMMAQVAAIRRRP